MYEKNLFYDMVKKMSENFQSYCDIGMINLILIIVIMLNPHYKLI